MFAVDVADVVVDAADSVEPHPAIRTATSVHAALERLVARARSAGNSNGPTPFERVA
jgi:hypothetical protein